jgi:hypothetical protein
MLFQIYYCSDWKAVSKRTAGVQKPAAGLPQRVDIAVQTLLLQTDDN